MQLYNILSRRLYEVNTDPQRRCYDGCHFKSEMVWSDWEILEFAIPEERINRRLEFWRELAAYAVSQRGGHGRLEYKAELNNTQQEAVIEH